MRNLIAALILFCSPAWPGSVAYAQDWPQFLGPTRNGKYAGTDHGGAGIGFLIGTKVKGQQIGTFPGVTNGLDAQGNLMPTSDFRAVYAALLEQWLDTDANPLIAGGSAYKRPALLK